MSLSDIARRVGKLAADNSPTILTVLGVTGTITTAYLTGRATIKAVELIRDEEDERREVIEPKEKVLLTWKLYIPAVGTAVLTVAAIICANRLGTRRAAAMAAAYNLSERAFAEYRNKVVEKIGSTKEQNVRDEIAQDRVNKSPASSNQIIFAGGSVLCHEAYTGRYFLSDIETLKKAQNDINYAVNNHYYASLTDFYEKIGLPQTAVSDELGWNSDKLLELEFSAVISEEGKPCIVINYAVAPIRGYNRLS